MSEIPTRLSEAGLAHLVRLEGLRLQMYRDSAGYPTIGIGHLLTARELATGVILLDGAPVMWRDGITEAEAHAICQQDVAWAVKAVRQSVQVPLQPHQFDALVSFTFNVGPGAFGGSTLLRRLNAGDYAAVPEQLMRWVYLGTPKKKSRGLENRRKAEAELWTGKH
jgi:lysozyme